MKKALKYLGLFAVLACLCLSLTACGGVTGTYKNVSEVKLGGYEVKTESTIKLKSGDACEMTTKVTTNGETESNTVKGTYKIDGETITITAESGGAPVTGTIKDGKITIAGVVYKK